LALFRQTLADCVSAICQRLRGSVPGGRWQALGLSLNDD
jgi:hypothetical protein